MNRAPHLRRDEVSSDSRDQHSFDRALVEQGAAVDRVLVDVRAGERPSASDLVHIGIDPLTAISDMALLRGICALGGIDVPPPHGDEADDMHSRVPDRGPSPRTASMDDTLSSLFTASPSP